MKYFLDGKEVTLGKKFVINKETEEGTIYFATNCLDAETAESLVELGIFTVEKEPDDDKITAKFLAAYFEMPDVIIDVLSAFDEFALHGIFARLASDYFQEMNNCQHDKMVYVIDLVADKITTIPWMGREKALRVAWFRNKEEAEQALEVVKSLDHKPSILKG